MDYKNQNLINQLTEDESFIRWAKNSNKNDVDYWNNWIINNPNKIECVELAKTIVLGLTFNKKSVASEKINDELDKVLAKINSRSASKDKISFKLFNYRNFAIAAILLLFISIGATLFLSSEKGVVHKTAYGEILDLQLPDGTSVVLNGNSQISYPKGDSRIITLVGEAYFKVKSIPATKAKFWVNTNDLQVEVYGTKFHVNTRKKKTKVVLDEGSIHLKLKNGLSKEMVPGDLVSFSKENNQISHKSVSKDTAYSLWRDGTYTFNNITFKDLMSNLEFSYGIKAEFIDKDLEELKLTGGIPNQNLKICIAAIEKVTGASVTQSNNKLIIKLN